MNTIYESEKQTEFEGYGHVDISNTHPKFKIQVTAHEEQSNTVVYGFESYWQFQSKKSTGYMNIINKDLDIESHIENYYTHCKGSWKIRTNVYNFRKGHRKQEIGNIDIELSIIETEALLYEDNEFYRSLRPRYRFDSTLSGTVDFKFDSHGSGGIILKAFQQIRPSGFYAHDFSIIVTSELIYENSVLSLNIKTVDELNADMKLDYTNNKGLHSVAISNKNLQDGFVISALLLHPDFEKNAIEFYYKGRILSGVLSSLSVNSSIEGYER